MLIRRRSLVFFLGFVVPLLGCLEVGNSGLGHGNKGPASAAAGERSDQFSDRLLEIARSYETYDRTDYAMRLTGVVCDFSPDRFISGLTPAGTFQPDPQPMHLSASGGPSTHGKKLYLVFTKNGQEATAASPAGKHPVGQVVVKEAWVPEEVKDDGQPLQPIARKVKVRREGESNAAAEEMELPVLPYARSNGRLYHAAQQAGLFIMFKLDPATPGTDEGWVYGTVTADGKQVTSAGRVEACIRCHANAPHDRVFGPRSN